MTVVVSLLRGVNVGGHCMIGMEPLRALHESIGLLDARTLLQSGNVVFRTKERDMPRLGSGIEDAIQAHFGFRPAVILRTLSELRGVIARNPHVGRADIEAGKFLVNFLPAEPGAEVRRKLLDLKTDPDELHLNGRELYYTSPTARDARNCPQFWTGY